MSPQATRATGATPSDHRCNRPQILRADGNVRTHVGVSMGSLPGVVVREQRLPSAGFTGIDMNEGRIPSKPAAAERCCTLMQRSRTQPAMRDVERLAMHMVRIGRAATHPP